MTSKEYFYITNSFAAPFFSDNDKGFIKGKNAKDAMKKLVKKYSHPCGLYSAEIYASSDDYHKNKKRLVGYLCNLEIEKQRITKDMVCFSFLNKGNGKIEIDEKEYFIKDYKAGKIID